MRYFILAIISLLRNEVYAQKCTPLQLDINFLSIGIQTSYQIHPKWNIYAVAGVGWGSLSNIYSYYYSQHSRHSAGNAGDIFLAGTHYIAPYSNLGVQHYA